MSWSSNVWFSEVKVQTESWANMDLSIDRVSIICLLNTRVTFGFIWKSNEMWKTDSIVTVFYFVLYKNNLFTFLSFKKMYVIRKTLRENLWWIKHFQTLRKTVYSFLVVLYFLISSFFFRSKRENRPRKVFSLILL